MRYRMDLRAARFGKVVKTTTFGAFVELAEGTDGAPADACCSSGGGVLRPGFPAARMSRIARGIA